MVLGRIPVAAPAGRMCVSVSVVLVPNRGDIARVGFEEEFRHRVEPGGWLLANGADLLDRCLVEGEFYFDHGATVAALKVVARHQVRLGSAHWEHRPQIAR